MRTPASASISGAAPDGTYPENSEAWGGSSNPDWRYIVDEKGRWTASGDSGSYLLRSSADYQPVFRFAPAK